ncbi:hypothetical protein PsalN5692_03924 (plasmid) [Piscirickettsia salmonis]|uniref:hypothetical protein n=2 Tax=Piscirickettsia salmonis TaxID=1238 RepID=UPI003EB831BD|nr:hypothetical protein PsalN5692_03924 [Piscirickettsia salmonis]
MSRCSWTLEETSIMLEHYLNKTAKEMMALLPGRNLDQIYSKAKRMGLTSIQKELPVATSNLNNNIIEVDLSSTEGVIRLVKCFNELGFKFVVKPMIQVKSA